MVGDNGNGAVRVRWDVIATVVAWLVGGLLAYASLDGRIKVLETKYERVADDIKEIKSDIKLILQMQRDPLQYKREQ